MSKSFFRKFTTQELLELSKGLVLLNSLGVFDCRHSLQDVLIEIELQIVKNSKKENSFEEYKKFLANGC
jgi:hypothetical protein